MNKMLSIHIHNISIYAHYIYAKLHEVFSTFLLFHTYHVLLNRLGGMEDESYSQDGEKLIPKSVI